MMRFSDRVGATKPPTTIQVGSVNDELRNSIWNFYLSVFDDSYNPNDPGLTAEHRNWAKLTRSIAEDVAKIPFDKIDRDEKAWTRHQHFDSQWHDMYNLLQHVVLNCYGIPERSPQTLDALVSRANAILEREMSGYRFIQGELAPITNKTEISAIENAISKAEEAGFEGISTHLQASLQMLSLKPEPDYRNSIKESISAVESAAKCLAGDKAGGLDQALAKLKSRCQIHPALEQGFLKLYGYTSDEGGIRHALMDAPAVGFDEAKFMLVSCSAFAHYLICKAETAELLS